MGRVPLQFDLSELKEWVDFRRFGTALFNAIVREFNGRIEFASNIKAFGPLEIEFPDTSVQTIFHRFPGGTVPQGFLVISLSTDMVVYRPSSPAWTADRVFLQSTAAGTAKIYLI